MSDYQVTNYGLCGECRFHRLEVIDNRPKSKTEQFLTTIGIKSGWVCTNGYSDYYGNFTEDTDTCECFEQRGKL